MRISELLEDVDFYQLSQIESFVEALWDRVGVDVKFTRHFLERLNDPRNGKPITGAELIRLFKKEYERYGKDIAKLESIEAVMKDLLTNINLPFVMKDTPQGKELVAKTIMRKQNFKTPDPEFVITESLSYQGNCTEDEVIEHLFGDATAFAQMIEKHGDNFVLGDLVVKYDPNKDVHYFYYKNPSMISETKKGKGDCFHVAGRNVLDAPSDDLKLVHAMVTGQGPLEGKRFAHAWNEIGDVVLDYSNGRKIVMRKDQYYKLGNVDTSPGNIAVYDGMDAIKNMAKYKHWGPWDLADENP